MGQWFFAENSCMEGVIGQLVRKLTNLIRCDNRFDMGHAGTGFVKFWEADQSTYDPEPAQICISCAN